jgi:hypothetical protein
MTTFSSTYVDIAATSASQSSTLYIGGINVGTIQPSIPATAYAPCASVVQIVKGSVVYVDDFTVSVLYSVRDASGRLQCAFGSGGAVTMTIGDGIHTYFTGTCSTSSFPNDKCTYTGTNSSLFTGRNLLSIVTVSYGGNTISSSAGLYFSPAPTPLTSYANLRGYLLLPKHKVFPGDTFTVPIYLNSPSWAVGACDMYIYYPTGLTYVAGSLSSSLFSPSPTIGAGFVRATFNLNKATAATTGVISVGSLQFTVAAASVASDLQLT